MNMTAGYTLFGKRASHLVTYKSVPSNIQVDYCLVNRNQKKVLKDMEVLTSRECITQYKLLIWDLMRRKIKNTRITLIPGRKIRKLHEDSVNSDFRSPINKYKEIGQKRCFCWSLLERSERSFPRGYKQ